jgi:hypothetical protein
VTEKDLQGWIMTKREVLLLLREAKTEEDLRIRCSLIKHRYGGKFPDFWYSEILSSGLLDIICGEGVNGTASF